MRRNAVIEQCILEGTDLKKTPESRAWPLRRLSKVFHVGTLSPQDKSFKGKSLEGNGLSVSLHPQAWRAIAKLGGMPRWKLSKPQPGQFLDAHALTGPHRAVILEWALEQGYLQFQEVWRVFWTDCETNDISYMEFDREEQASQEHELRLEDEDPNLDIQKVLKERATNRMTERIGFDLGSACDFDLATTLFAEDVLRCDGVWWNDQLDVAALSAPRGVINLPSLPTWHCEQIE